MIVYKAVFILSILVLAVSIFFLVSYLKREDKYKNKEQ